MTGEPVGWDDALHGRDWPCVLGLTSLVAVAR